MGIKVALEMVGRVIAHHNHLPVETVRQQLPIKVFQVVMQEDQPLITDQVAAVVLAVPE